MPTPTPTATPTNGVITGQLFLDFNGNGYYDDGDLLLTGIVTSLIDSKVTDQTTTITTITDIEGIFRFVGVPPSSYTIKIALPPGYEAVNASSLQVTVPQLGNVTVPIIPIQVDVQHMYLPFVGR